MNDIVVAHRREAVATHPLIFQEYAFGGAVRRARIRYGATVAEMVMTIAPYMRDFDTHSIEIRIDGEKVPAELWAFVRTRERGAGRETRVVISAEFGKGGGTLSTVIQIAALVAAVAVSGGALAPLGAIPFAGSFLATGTIGASLAAAGIIAAGSLAATALSAPPSLAAISGPGGLGAEQNVSNLASLSGNVLAPGAPLPRCLGEHRVFPQVVCPVLLELDGDDEIGEVVFALAGPHAISDVRSGKTAVDDIEEIEYETLTGLTGAVPTLVTRQSITDQPALELARHQINKDLSSSSRSLLSDQATPANSLPHWHRLVTRDDPDEIWFTLQWPQGLVQTTNLGGNCGMPVRIRMRPRGSSTWRNLPEIHFVNSKINTYKKDIRLIFGAQPFSFPQPPLLESPWAVFRAVPTQTVTPSGTGGWTAHSSFNNGTGSTDVLWSSTTGTTRVTNVHQYPGHVEIYLNHADFPSGETWEVEIMGGSAYRYTEFTPGSYVLGGNVDDMFGYEFTGSSYIALYNMFNFNYRCDVIRFASIWNENPVATAGDAVIAMTFRNRAVERVSCLASGYVSDYNAGTGQWDNMIATDNPAPHYRDVLMGSLNAYPVEADAIDVARLVTWRQYCIDNDRTVNAVIEGRSVDDVLTLLAGLGDGRPVQNEGRTVFVDEDVTGDAPVQMFSPRNARSFRFEKAFPFRPDGFRGRYSDVDEDFQEKEIIVLDPSGTDNGRYEDIRIDGLVEEAKVEARLLRLLKESRLRATFYSIEANLQHVVAVRGDLCGLSHRALSAQFGSAYVEAVEDDGAGNITGITLDGSVGTAHFFTEPAEFFTGFSTFFTENNIGVAMRLKDGSVMTAQVASFNAETRELTFTTPFADLGVNDAGDDILGRGCLVFTGPLDSEMLRVKVWSVEPKAGGTATVTFVDEAPALHA